ncbi:MAG: hypothetical protein JJE47_18060 [Acidimicrobiia bacterium]|nr:hypothetical protein [Acidimicrobiia bacterium]
MASIHLPFLNDDRLAAQVARSRMVGYALLAAIAIGSALVAPTGRSIATLGLLLIAGSVPMRNRRDPVRHLFLAFKLDAVAFLGMWWLMGPVAGLGVGLFLVAALAGIILPSREALLIGFWVLVSEAVEIPLHWIAMDRGGLPLIHSPVRWWPRAGGHSRRGHHPGASRQRTP